MAIYSASQSCPAAQAQGFPICDVKASPVSSLRILEVSLFAAVTTANTFSIGIGRSSNTPVQSGATTFTPEAPNDPASSSAIASAWSVAPTVPTQFFRRKFPMIGIAGGLIWSFPRGLSVPASASVVLWMITAGSLPVMTNTWVIDE